MKWLIVTGLIFFLALVSCDEGVTGGGLALQFPWPPSLVESGLSSQEFDNERLVARIWVQAVLSESQVVNIPLAVGVDYQQEEYPQNQPTALSSVLLTGIPKGDSFRVQLKIGYLLSQEGLDSITAPDGTYWSEPEDGNFLVFYSGTSELFPISVGDLSSTSVAMSFLDPDLGIPVYFVDGGAAAGGDGLSWATAWNNLQYAIDSVTAPAHLWVKEGTYRPDSHPNGGSGSQEVHFSLKNNVTLYGGFAGTETRVTQRDYRNRVTLLEGDLNGDDVRSGEGSGLVQNNYSDNLFHLFYHPAASGLNLTAVLDGFTLAGGAAQGAGAGQNYGGALYSSGCSPTFRNVVFRFNQAADRGGAIYLENGSDSVFYNCVLSRNLLTGAVNTLGGGIYHENSRATFINTVFYGNYAGLSTGQDGGSVYLESTNGADPREAFFYSCTFTESDASQGLEVYDSGLNTDTWFVNTILYDSGWDPYVSGGGNSVTLRHCLLSDFNMEGVPSLPPNATNPDTTGIYEPTSAPFNSASPAATDGKWFISSDLITTTVTDSGRDLGDPLFLPVDALDLDEDGDSVETVDHSINGARVAGSEVDIGAYESP